MKKIVLVLLMAIFLLGCQNNEPNQEQAGFSLPSELPEGFIDFYQRFLTDSLFQMEHILFPLQGLPNRVDSLTLADNTFRWQMEDWVMHRPVDPNSGFSVNIQPLTNTLILEKIRHESGGYGMERRFALFDDGWYLVYYAGLNSIEE